jgi:hypothetical protein
MRLRLFAYHGSMTAAMNRTTKQVGLLLVALLTTTPTLADTHYVSKTGSNTPPYTSWGTATAIIQQAISVADDGDSILVAAGTYAGDGNRDLDCNGKKLNLLASSGPIQTVIDCGGNESEPHRGFYFHSGEDSNTVIGGFTITNGYAPGDPGMTMALGGGMFCSTASPTIRDCTFEANVAQNGGGGLACVNNSAPNILNCRFLDNIADNGWPAPIAGYGGAIRSVSSSPSLNACSFLGNMANIGGAISCSMSDLRADSCAFVANTAITFFTFEPESNGVGGGLHIFASAPMFSRCTFIANVAEPEDLMAYYPGQGGAAYMYLSDPVFANCTLYGNRANRAKSGGSGEGGAFWLAESSPTVERCIISSSLDGEAIYCFDTTSRPVLLCSDVMGNFGGDWIGCISDQAQSAGNFALNPGFCDTSALDFSLEADSPCLPQNNLCGQLVGAAGQGCVATAINEPSLEVAIPTSYLLLANYPNPFNASTQISYTLAQPGTITLTIYDVLGRHVNTLVDDVQTAGEHSVMWHGMDRHGQDVGSGVYFYRLSVGGESEVRKMVVVK